MAFPTIFVIGFNDRGKNKSHMMIVQQ
jgi:hypothetical protein